MSEQSNIAKNNSDVRVLIAEINGTMGLVLSKIEDLSKRFDGLDTKAVTKEDLQLVIIPMQKRLEIVEANISKIQNYALGFISVILLGLVGFVLASVIPGFSL